jgi:diaminopimelate epimerase
MELKIEYYSGAGNIFSIFDNRSIQLLDNEFEKLAKIACNKSISFTLDTEGLIIIDNLKTTENINSFNVYFFNPDGSSGMMCGNGARCSVKFAMNKKIIVLEEFSDSISFKLAGEEYIAWVESGLIKVQFPKHIFSDINFKVPFENKILVGSFADVGTIHLIFQYHNIPEFSNFMFEYFPLIDFAKPIRYNTTLFPKGVNVSIVEIIDSFSIKLRTYERGVEGETGACGTGAIAAALLLFQQGLINNKVSIIPSSKSILEVEILTDEKNEISGFTLMGDAFKIGETIIEYN